MQIIGSAKESPRKILLVGEFDEYPDEKDCTARLAEMLDQFSDDLHKNAENSSTKEFLMEEIKENSMKHVREVLEMEKLNGYTRSPDYMTENNKLMANQDILWNAIFHDEQSQVLLEGIGLIQVDHLRQNMNTAVQQVFELKMRVIAYWKIAVRRLTDNIALYLQFNINSLAKTDLEKEIVADMLSSPIGGGIERLLEELSSVSLKRNRLNRNVKAFEELKRLLTLIFDRTTGYDNLISLATLT
ncbi:hypothetical protein L6164_017346 [Bauhinia variegata]|uniref:Uncharacterized protein n=1 Tax=Bauhinia variegata TaxID=167791 RepID=A0ACB9N885_BAUVA|nr:hypothetical protein L6164_017346 [Bauhinia variegata]